jgi:hypothetical protein
MKKTPNKYSYLPKKSQSWFRENKAHPYLDLMVYLNTQPSFITEVAIGLKLELLSHDKVSSKEKS